MRIELDRVLTNFDGKPIMEGDQTVSLRIVLARAYAMTRKEDEALPVEEKVRRYSLAQNVMSAESSVDLSVENLALAKAIINSLYPIHVVGAAVTLLDPPASD